MFNFEGEISVEIFEDNVWNKESNLEVIHEKEENQSDYVEFCFKTHDSEYLKHLVFQINFWNFNFIFHFNYQIKIHVTLLLKV